MAAIPHRAAPKPPLNRPIPFCPTGRRPHRKSYRPLLRPRPRQPLGACISGLQFNYRKPSRIYGCRCRQRFYRPPERGENDEFVKATRIGDAVQVEDGDSVIFMNFRPDRAREITNCFVDDQFSGFTRNQRLNWPTLS